MPNTDGLHHTNSDSFTHYDTHDARRRLLMQEIAGKLPCACACVGTCEALTPLVLSGGTCHEQWNCITGL
eukprot:2905875-Rhodomonas_salina.2